MNSALIDENTLIERIKVCGEQIFKTHQNTFGSEDSFNFSFSSSENQQYQRRKPLTIRQNKVKKKSVYGKDYVSPYSKKGMDKGVTSRTTIINHQKMTKQINKRIEKMEMEERSIKKQKNKSSESYSHVKSKYKKKQLLIKNFDLYVQKNCYKKLKTQATSVSKKYSKEEKQQKWGQFLTREQKWQSKKKTNATKARIQKLAQTDEEMNKTVKPIIIPPLSIEDCLGKLKRQTLKLKEQLQNHRFEPTLYHTQRVWKSSRSKEKSGSKISIFGENSIEMKGKKLKKVEGQKTQRKIPILNDPIQELKFIIT